MDSKGLIVYKSNDLIEASYRLSLNEQRVILECIGRVHSEQELLVTDTFTLSAKDFAERFSVSEDAAYLALSNVTESLFKRYLVINDPLIDEPEAKQLKTRWISSIVYFPEKGMLRLRFSYDILPYLSQLRGGFTKYKLENIGKMSCVYAIRLYELLVQWQGTGTREIKIDWLKQQFELDDSYNRMDNLKRRVLEPAIKQINAYSNLSVSYTQRKSGRKVTHLTFTFSDKEQHASSNNPKPPAKTTQKKNPASSQTIENELEKMKKAVKT